MGSTGSVGSSALQVVRHLKDELEVVGLAVHSNIAALYEQVQEFQPKIVAVYDAEKARELQAQTPFVRVVTGMDGVQEVARHGDVQFVLCAMAGAVGILPTLAAIEAGKQIGLANKEVLVAAGEYVMRLAARKGVQLIPVDSEHSALFQCLQGVDKEAVRRLILTTSGGPFYRYPAERLQQISLQEALTHPTWRMGPKVTVDSSTLMNKGLEVIEAHFLFQVPVGAIEVVVHPQSVVHSLVECVDGCLLAQLGVPDMRLPIQYALTYPKRCAGSLPPFDFREYQNLTFDTPDVRAFRCLGLAYEALKLGGSAPCYLNAANEVLVQRFLNREIPWIDIANKLQSLLLRHSIQRDLDLEGIFAVDALARADALVC